MEQLKCQEHALPAAPTCEMFIRTEGTIWLPEDTAIHGNSMKPLQQSFRLLMNSLMTDLSHTPRHAASPVVALQLLPGKPALCPTLSKFASKTLRPLWNPAACFGIACLPCPNDASLHRLHSFENWRHAHSPICCSSATNFGPLVMAWALLTPCVCIEVLLTASR